MHIFIDESGTFTGVTNQHNISAVGALIIPDIQLAKVERKYRALRSDLPQERGEAKGRLLSEHQVASVVSMLARYQVLFEITAIDMGLHGAADIDEHKRQQAEGLTINVTDAFHPNARAGIFALRRRLEEMTQQLYVQSIVTFDVIETVIRHAVLYYCQRIPRELAAFHWVIDGKDKARITDWESWWSVVVMPMLQTGSLREPMAAIAEGDYSHFDRFRMAIPDYLAPHVPNREAEFGTDLRKLMTEHFRFSSDAEPGLEMVDILANAVRRAMVGNLGIKGWQDIRGLMIHRRTQCLRMVSLTRAESARDTLPYIPVLRHFLEGGRNMLAPRFLRPTAMGRDASCERNS